MEVFKSDSSFGDIKCGGIFEYDREYYMKIINGSCNAVNIRTGTGCNFLSSNPVTYYPDATVHLLGNVE